MGRVIVSIISLLILATIIVVNIGTTTVFDLVVWQFDELPVVVIGIVAFVAGALYSFTLYLMRFFGRRRKERLEREKKRLSTERETMDARERELADADRSGQEAGSISEAATSSRGRSPGGGVLSGLFRRRK